MSPESGSRGVIADLESSLCQDPDVEFAVCFGSQIHGDRHDGSDIEVAVQFSEGSPLANVSGNGVFSPETSSEKTLLS